MKKKIIIIVTGTLSIATVVLVVIYFGIGITVKSNIKHCQALYSGSAEEALISYMLDESKHPENRSHIAIWTLAQIESDKALPHLRVLYQNDPKGVSCKEKHDSLLCQYEIYKAISTIEKGRIISYERFKK